MAARVHAELQRPVVPDEQHLTVRLVDVGDAGVRRSAHRESHRGPASRRPEVARRPSCSGQRNRPRKFELFPLGPYRAPAPNSSPAEHVRVVEELRGVEAASWRASAPCGRGIRVPSSPADPPGGARGCPVRRRAERLPGRRDRDSSSGSSTAARHGSPPAGCATSQSRRASVDRTSSSLYAAIRSRMRRIVFFMYCSYSTTAAEPWSMS